MLLRAWDGVWNLFRWACPSWRGSSQRSSDFHEGCYISGRCDGDRNLRQLWEPNPKDDKFVCFWCWYLCRLIRQRVLDLPKVWEWNRQQLSRSVFPLDVHHSGKVSSSPEHLHGEWYESWPYQQRNQVDFWREVRHGWEGKLLLEMLIFRRVAQLDIHDTRGFLCLRQYSRS